MEGKKVLWVVFSIALALVVILAAGLFLLRPRQPKSSETSGTGTPSLRGYDPYEYVRGASVPPGLSAPPSEPRPKVLVVGEPPPPEPQGQAPQERAGAGAAAETPPAQPAVPPPSRENGLPQPPLVAQGLPSQRPPSPQGQLPQEGVASKRVPPERIAAAPRAAAKPVPAARPAVTPERAAPKRAGARPKAVSVTEYWIQTGSFSSAARADEVSRRLEEKGLAARTTTRDLNGKTHFRVRVGPYASKAEAEKFLDWIQELKGFETSYISMVASRRVMP
jgi:cell division protein FtsN